MTEERIKKLEHNLAEAIESIQSWTALHRAERKARQEAEAKLAEADHEANEWKRKYYDAIDRLDAAEGE